MKGKKKKSIIGRFVDGLACHKLVCKGKKKFSESEKENELNVSVAAGSHLQQTQSQKVSQNHSYLNQNNYINKRQLKKKKLNKITNRYVKEAGKSYENLDYSPDIAAEKQSSCYRSRFGGDSQQHN